MRTRLRKLRRPVYLRAFERVDDDRCRPDQHSQFEAQVVHNKKCRAPADDHILGKITVEMGVVVRDQPLDANIRHPDLSGREAGGEEKR